MEEDIFQMLCKEKYNQKVKEIQLRYTQIKEDILNKIVRWMKLKGKDCYLEETQNVLVPDTRKLKLTYIPDRYCVSSVQGYQELCRQMENLDEEALREIKEEAKRRNAIMPSDFETVVEGFSGEPISDFLCKKLFDESSTLHEDIRYIILNNSISSQVYNSHLGAYQSIYGCRGSCVLKMSVHRFEDKLDSAELILKYGLCMEMFSDSLNKEIEAWSEIFKNDVNIEDFDEIKAYFKSQEIESFLNVDLRMEAIENELESIELHLSEDDLIGKKLINHYENCDYNRVHISKYSAKDFMSDEGKGHWDFWNVSSKCLENKRVLKLKEGVVARNPLVDVKHNAVVGIDFGTKSTIVTAQDGDEEIIPLRVGMADYSLEPKAEHFENPTVMQFVDFNTFMNHYRKSVARPITFWKDLLISHEAFQNLICAKDSNEINSFVTNLKQWASGQYENKIGMGHLIIKDQTGYRYDIEQYMNLTLEDIDLIEIYAYYIGVFINNMYNGIYLDYILSFPETFSKEVKDKVLESFKRGIYKSIPEIVMCDEACAEEFRVRQGPTEPAAYAACALEQYGIEPTDEGVFYGIFDFGGGTTDYDYGIWKNAPKDEFTYNYIIKHYGSGGDKTLGGENLLQLLAYYVFSDDSVTRHSKSNRQIMRENNLSYYRPSEGKIYPGTETLNNNSGCAILNMNQMMEALRPYWEEWEEWEKVEISEHVNLEFAGEELRIQLLLFSEKERIQVTLYADLEMMDNILNQRIEIGVRNFFEGLAQAYQDCEEQVSEKILLFLAGNSSKSSKVRQLFEKYVIEYNKIMFGILLDDSLDLESFKLYHETQDIALNVIEDNQFMIYPPLGTKEAYFIQEQNGMHVEENDLMAPTGKTGVAFGLIMCREGSMIKVESEFKENEQIKLNYYIGINYKKKFKHIFERSIEYDKWYPFSKIMSGTQTFEFYYSTLPEVVNDCIEIKGNKSIYKQKCIVDNVISDARIYFRFTTPETLEYVVALDEKIELEEYLSKVYKVQL